MTTSADIEDAWADVWDHADILALTDKIHLYQITLESETEIAKLYSGTEVNFFEVLTARTQQSMQTATTLGETVNYKFLVEINYYRELDTDGTNFRAIRDAYETIFDLVKSELGNDWSNTVDLWHPDEGYPSITETTLNNKKCWKGTHRYFAEKLTEL